MNQTRRSFVKYVSLNVCGMIGMSCYILADTFFVSKALGSTGLAALNFCIAFFSVMQGFGLMIGIGGATRYTILRNSGEKEGTDEVFTHALLLGGAVAVILLLIGIFFSGPLATVLGADEVTFPLAKTYLTTVLCFAPFFVINNIVLAFVRNDGSPKLSMTAMLVSSFSNVVLDYIFMFPLSMGMFGAAFATGLSPVLSLCILSLHFVKRNNHFTFRRCRIRVKSLWDIATLGASSFIGEMSSAIVLITFNLAILKIEGNIGVAAYGIVANIALIATAMFTGVAQGLQPLASQGYGTGDRVLIRQVSRYAIVTALGIATVIYVVLSVWCAPVTAIFNSEGNEVLARLAMRGLRIYFVGFFFAGINIVAAAVFSATSAAGKAFFVSILRSCVLIIPMVLLMSHFLKMDGIWLSFVVTEFMVCLISLFFFARVFGKKKLYDRT